jgi:hypothetical protein
MKHLKKFENFSEIKKNQYDNITSNKEDLENSTAFEELPDNEQEILSDTYSKESETIGEIDETDEIKNKVKQLTKYSTLEELFGQSNEQQVLSGVYKKSSEEKKAEFDKWNKELTTEKDREVLLKITEIIESSRWEEFSKPFLIFGALEKYYGVKLQVKE